MGISATTYVDTGSALEIGDAFDNVGAVGVGKGAGGSGGGLLYLADPVTLNGGGTLTLGVTSSGSGFNYGDIEDAPGTSGDGLINVNNTITGGGTISVDSFDNQSGGTVEASQSGGYSLKITAATFTNEGVLEAESGATLAINSNVGTSEGGTHRSTLRRHGHPLGRGRRWNYQLYIRRRCRIHRLGRIRLRNSDL